MGDGIAEEIETLDIFEIADVLAQEREVAARQADRILHLSADRKNLREFFVQSHRRRHIASRSPYLSQPASRMTNDRIVTTKEDFAIVHKKEVGDAA